MLDIAQPLGEGIGALGAGTGAGARQGAIFG